MKFFLISIIISLLIIIYFSKGKIEHFTQKYDFTKEEYKYIHVELLDILSKILKLFEKHNIQYWVGGGTLLGCIRENSIIKYDDDIDLYLFKKDFLYIQNNNNNIIQDLENVGLKLIKRGDTFDHNKIMKNRNNEKNNIFIDIMCFGKENNKFKDLSDTNVKEWPEDYFTTEELLPLKKGKLNNIIVNIPNNPINNLKRMYGDCSKQKCWKVPEPPIYTHKDELNISI
tara:strand:- start:3471 stop:4154 length:684 start_codon:yes stop_codon:yes gene_type:complete